MQDWKRLYLTSPGKVDRGFLADSGVCSGDDSHFPIQECCGIVVRAAHHVFSKLTIGCIHNIL